MLVPKNKVGMRAHRLRPQIVKAIEAFFEECDDIMLAIMAAGVPQSRIRAREPSWRWTSDGNVEMDFYYGVLPERN